MFAGSPKDARKKTVVSPDISKTTFIYDLAYFRDDFAMYADKSNVL